MKKACVIGWPIAHSRSPLIHNYWLKLYGLTGNYDRVPVAPENLASFLRSLEINGFVGCNVTLPHKENALLDIDFIDHSVKRIGALNTVYVRQGKTYATSTDGEGFYQNLRAHVPNFDPTNKHITVLGAGGSAKAIIDRLVRENIAKITVINRTPSRAEDIKRLFGSKITVGTHLGQCDLLINTTAQGMTGQSPLHIDLTVLPPEAIVADIVYVPLKTQLLKDAAARGHIIVPGLGMLLHQAVHGFELWFGVKPQVTSELYDLVACDIDPDFVS